MFQNLKESKYFKGAMMIFAGGALIILFYFLLANFGDFRAAVQNFNRVISPFIYGFILAYLLSPFYNFAVRKLFGIFKTKSKTEAKALGISRAIASILSFLFLIGVIGGFLAILLPQLVESIMGIVNTMPSRLNALSGMISNLLEHVDNENLVEQIENIYANLQNSVVNWLQNWVGPNMTAMLDTVSSRVIITVRAIVNMFIGVIVCFYLLNSKEKFKAQCKKIAYAIFRKDIAEHMFAFVEYTNKTFFGFINGKIIDSIIIGIICFVAMTILKLPYPSLIGLVIGVTNFIPFFGPFIGAIPSFIIIFLVSPLQSLYFLILVVVLQQLDGNIIGPKILGNSTGLGSFWVMFAIIVGGGLFGFVGMIVGVPIFAVIYHYITMFVNERLKKKEMPVPTTEYESFEKFGIPDEEMKEIEEE